MALDAAAAAERTFMEGLARLSPALRVGVAVSGGGDSMALALLALRWSQQVGGSVVAATVDHGLRPESAAEARTVGDWLRPYGIEHTILRWDGPKPAADRQAAARRARYALLKDWAGWAGVRDVLLAHHQDDQAETFLLRLERGSGVDGLSAMAPVRDDGSVRWLRPLLEVPKADLLAWLDRQGQDWLADPSNHNPLYRRVHWRQHCSLLAAAGLTPAGLAATARRLRRARVALEEVVDAAWSQSVAWSFCGYGQIAVADLLALPEEVGLRLLVRLLRTVVGLPYPPRLERLERLYDRLRTIGDGDSTLSGCRLVWRDGILTVGREAAKMAPPVSLQSGGRGTWDGRFAYTCGPDVPSGLRLGALGAMGRRRLGSLVPPSVMIPPLWVRSTLPAVWDARDDVCAIPHLGYLRGDLPASPCALFPSDLPLGPEESKGVTSGERW